MSNLADRLLKEMTGSLGVSGPASGFKVPRRIEEPKRIDKLKKRRGETDEEFEEVVAPSLKVMGIVESLLIEDETRDLQKMARVVRARCIQVEKALKKQQLGLTAEAFTKAASALDEQDQERSSFDMLMDSEKVLLASIMKTCDIALKLQAILEAKPFHDYCQELRPEVDQLVQQVEELTGESRRLSQRQLENDGSLELQLYKYRESTREWADRFDERINNSAERFI